MKRGTPDARAGGDHGDGGADVGLQEVHIVLGLLRQGVVVLAAADIALPAGEGGEHGLGLHQQGRDGEGIGDLAVDLVAGADLDLVQVAQHVQTGESHLSGALHHAAVLGGHGVKPAHTAGTAGGGTELALVAAAAAQLVALLAQQLADEGLGVGAHRGGIGLGNTDDVLHRGGRHRSAHTAEAGQGVGGGGHGEDAQIGVLHGAQLTLQQDGLALLQSLVDKAHGVAHIGTDLLPQGDELVKQLVHAEGGLVVQVLEENVLQGDGGLQTLPQALLVKQVAHLHADLGVLVGVEGGNAALGGTKGTAGQTLLLIGVLEHVIGHEDLTALRDDEVGGGDALVGDGLQLVHQLADVQGHAVADDVGDVGVEGAGGEDVKGKAAVIVDDGVARVGSALKADDHVGRFGQHIGDLALALVAPVGAYDRFYHNCYLREPGFATAERICLIRFITQHPHYTAFSPRTQGERM